MNKLPVCPECERELNVMDEPDRLCSNCGACWHCCQCERCDSCGERQFDASDMCAECNHCPDCCTCDEDGDLDENFDDGYYDEGMDF